MSNRKFVDGMLVNAGMIVAGVAFLLWLSTLGDSDIKSKVEFYGTTAGQLVSFVVFFIPFVVLSKKIGKSELSNARLIISILMMISVQLVIAAYIPFIVDLYRGIGVGIGSAVIEAKG